VLLKLDNTGIFDDVHNLRVKKKRFLRFYQSPSSHKNRRGKPTLVGPLARAKKQTLSGNSGFFSLK
jgi:hypothetical protein